MESLSKYRRYGHALMAVAIAFPSLAAAQTTCDPFGFLKQGRMHVYNNVWGVGENLDPVKGFRQCTTLDGSAVRFEWSNFAPGKGSVKSYPHLTVGWDWDGKVTEGSLFPMPVEKAASLYSVFDIEARGTGRYNVSFDIWLSRKRTPEDPRQDLTHEVMIWLDNQGITTTRPLTAARVTIDGREFDLYIGDTPLGNWRYIAFKARQPVLRGSIALGPFFTFLRQAGVMRGDEFINGVSLGPEIVDGSGSATVKRFEIKP